MDRQEYLDGFLMDLTTAIEAARTRGDTSTIEIPMGEGSNVEIVVRPSEMLN